MRPVMEVMRTVVVRTVPVTAVMMHVRTMEMAVAMPVMVTPVLHLRDVGICLRGRHRRRRADQ